jgi:DNA-binding NarL/FixJ family response regulator
MESDIVRPCRLSARELEVITAKAKGQTIKQISQNLTISGRTVKAHLFNVRRKMGVKSTEQAIYQLAQSGLI